MKKILSAVAVLAAVAGVYACSDDHDSDDHPHIPTDGDGGHTSPYPSCNAITQACHKFDVGEGEIHDCHEIAHDAKSEEPCAARKNACLELCVDEAGASDASADARRAD